MYELALARGSWLLKTLLLESRKLGGLLLVDFSISFAIVISSSSKEPQENSLNNLVFKKVLGLLKDSFVSSGMLVTILRSVVR